MYYERSVPGSNRRPPACKAAYPGHEVRLRPLTSNKTPPIGILDLCGATSGVRLYCSGEAKLPDWRRRVLVGVCSVVRGGADAFHSFVEELGGGRECGGVAGDCGHECGPVDA
jgi:hypothetical protein